MPTSTAFDAAASWAVSAETKAILLTQHEEEQYVHEASKPA